MLAPNKALRFYVSDENGETKRYQDKGIWVMSKGKPERLSIKTGVSDDDYTEISGNGLHEGTEIIVEDKTVSRRNSEMRMRMPR